MKQGAKIRNKNENVRTTGSHFKKKDMAKEIIEEHETMDLIMNDGDKSDLLQQSQEIDYKQIEKTITIERSLSPDRHGNIDNQQLQISLAKSKQRGDQ